MRLAIIIALTIAVAAHSEMIYVNAESSADGDGSSWTRALSSLRSALAKAASGDEIWVAEGTYYPGKPQQRRRTFTLKNKVSVFGGFSGDEVRREDRDAVKHRTILSGNIGDPSIDEDNVRRVVSAIDVGAETILDGFTITGGHHVRHRERGRGAGLYLLRSSLHVRYCRMVDNYGAGGGVWNELGNPTLEDCVIRRNAASGVTNYTGNPTLIRCLVARNHAVSDAGGIGNISSSAVPRFVGCVVKHNVATQNGGGYYGWGSPVFESCLFQKNRAGGGVASVGGAMFLRSGRAVLANCSIVGNRTPRHEAGVVAFNDSNIPVISSCLIWGNKADQLTGDPELLQLSLEKGSVNNCVVQHWTGRYGGEGNFDADPKFVGPGRKNLRLAHDSPCIDAGNDEAVTEPTDLDGNPRILGGRVDIGGYENVCREVIDLVATVVEDDSENHTGDGDGVCEPGEDCVVTATVAVDAATMPEGSTVRVVFTPVDGNGEPDPDACCADHTCGPDARCPTVRKARINAAGAGSATLRGCAGGPWTVCVEGCGEALCEQVGCP